MSTGFVIGALVGNSVAWWLGYRWGRRDGALAVIKAYRGWVPGAVRVSGEEQQHG